MPETEPVVVRGVADQIVELPIAHGPATGYRWVLDLPPGVVQIEDASAPPVDPKKLLGASATGAIRVVAPRGHFRISARLVRFWEPEMPAETKMIELIIE